MPKYLLTSCTIVSLLVTNLGWTITPDGVDGSEETTNLPIVGVPANVAPAVAAPAVVVPEAVVNSGAKVGRTFAILENLTVAAVKEKLHIGTKDVADLEDAGFGSFIEFETDSDTVIPSAGLHIILDALLDLEPDASILVVGHTDDVGEDDYNMDLSERRADSVRDWLEENGVRVGAIKIKGMGFHRPIDDNDTPEGRRRNRRVEFARIYE